jgi:hypothetical protein
MTKTTAQTGLHLAAVLIPLTIGAARLSMLALLSELTLVALLGEVLGVLILAILANWTVQLAWPSSGISHRLAATLCALTTIGVAVLLTPPPALSTLTCAVLVIASQFLLLFYLVLDRAIAALKPAPAKVSQNNRKKLRYDPRT